MLRPFTHRVKRRSSPVGKREIGNGESLGAIEAVVEEHDAPAVVSLEAVLRRHSAPVRALAFSADGAILASGGDDRTACVWDVARAEPKAILGGHRGAVTALALSRSTRALVTAGVQDDVRLWDVGRRRTLSILPRPGAGLAVLASFPDRETFAVSMEQRVLLWAVPSGAATVFALQEYPHASLYHHTAVAFSPDGKTMATGSTSVSWERGSGSSFESVRLWDVASGRLKRTLPQTPPMGSFAFSPDGSVLAAGQGSQEGPHEVHLWDLATGQSLAVISAGVVDAWVAAVAFSPDGTALLVGTVAAPARLRSGARDAAIMLLNVVGIGAARSELVLTRLRLGSPASQLAISPDGTRVASAADGDPHVVRVWRVEHHRSRPSERRA
jgi:dipeptidyl aminopeptidase/acylaminoacyl peptidase